MEELHGGNKSRGSSSSRAPLPAPAGLHPDPSTAQEPLQAGNTSSFKQVSALFSNVPEGFCAN